ncbi:MAG TPA: protein kinase [Thermoanaerobaculia bacterium]|nr:protein kinase [Thermoanaerobaculia bacterium]
MDLHAGAHMGPYEILDSLGAGGMGEVYRARDTRIGREVAVKILPDAHRLESDRLHRFEQEARAAGALNHPNLVTIHDVGTHEGTPYIVMELLEGETLREKIASTHPLPPRKTIDYAAQIAAGLAAAHERGIIHRDLKPENIMITGDGRVKILDFGLAKLRAPEEAFRTDEVTAHRGTRTGTVLGTASYMSPEQVRAEQVDARSDIFALGTILHEMLSGASPFHRGSSADTTSAILRDDPPPLPPSARTHPSLVRVVHRCLEKNPEERFQSARDLAFDLQAIEDELRTGPRTPIRRSMMPLLASGVVVALAVALLLTRPHGSEKPATSSAERNMIVIFPFENLGDPADAYFAAGITEEITSRLASVQDLGVISRTTAVEYSRKGKTLKQVGQELGVDYVLEGSVRWDKPGNRVRVTPQLIRVSDDTHLWADRYDRKLDQIFEVQSNIAEEVVRQLDVKLLERERRALDARPTDNLEAYELYLRARNENVPEERSLRTRVALLEQAVRLDSKFAFAHAELGSTHAAMYHWGFDRASARLQQADRSINAALVINPQLPEAHRARGFYYYWGFLDYQKALEEFAIARESRPNDAQLLRGIAFVNRRQGRFEEAVRNLLAAQRLDPRNAQAFSQLGITYMRLRRFEKAEQMFVRATNISPHDTSAHSLRLDNLWHWKASPQEGRRALEGMPDTGDEHSTFMWYEQELLEGGLDGALKRLTSSNVKIFHFAPVGRDQAYLPKQLLVGQTYALMGDSIAARESFQAALPVLGKAAGENPEDARIHSALGLAYAGLGRKEDAIREGELAVQMYPLSKDALLGTRRLQDLAQIYAAVGEKEKAIGVLEKLLSIPSLISTTILKVDPAWDPLRGHPRFEALLREEPDAAAQ